MENIDPDVANALLLTAFSAELGSGDAEFEALIEQLTTACDLPELALRRGRRHVARSTVRPAP